MVCDVLIWIGAAANWIIYRRSAYVCLTNNQRHATVVFQWLVTRKKSTDKTATKNTTQLENYDWKQAQSGTIVEPKITMKLITETFAKYVSLFKL